MAAASVAAASASVASVAEKTLTVDLETNLCYTKKMEQGKFSESETDLYYYVLGNDKKKVKK